jgi:hypothetical protein
MEQEANIESGGPVQAEGESITATNSEPTAEEGLFDGMTAEQLHNSYKSLQGELGKRTESFNDLEGQLSKYGGADQLLQWAEFLDGSKEFADWYQNQQQAQTLGTSLDDLDDDTKQAIELVQRMSKSEIDKAMQEQVAPLQNAYKEQIFQTNIDAMTEKYGDRFDKMRDTMAEIAADMPMEMQDNPTVDTLDDLFWKAMRVSGEMDNYAAEQYQKKLESKKSMSMDAPTKKTNVGTKSNVVSMLDAYNAAKAAQG